MKPKKRIRNDGKIIWQYWAQGYRKNDIPEFVQICMDSVSKYAKDYTIVRLSDSNLFNYIEIPDFIQEKRESMSQAHFSDLLRLILLSVYGGIWIDASVLLTGDLPSYIFNEEFFMYQRDKKEANKKYWENSYAYYFGWYKGFRVNVLNGIMYSKPKGIVITDLCSMMLDYWSNNDKAIDYFFFQILFDVYIKKHPNYNCVIMNDCIPHLLRQLIADNYPISFDEIKHQTSIHSLSRKQPSALPKLKQLLSRNDEEKQ